MKELLEDLKGRIRNRFLLSFIIAWLYKHWLLIYWILTCDPTISVYKRVSIIEAYIVKQGWENLILIPFGLACIAMPLYLIIANLSQWIYVWVGKRLNAFLLSKADKGKYTLTTKLEKAQDKFDKLKADFENTRNENQSLEEKYNNLLKSNSTLYEEKLEAHKTLAKVQSDKQLNLKFKETTLPTLIFLLAKFSGREIAGLEERSIVQNEAHIIQGSWDLHIYQKISNLTSGYDIRKLIFEDKKVKDDKEKQYGEITFIKFDRSTLLLSFEIKRLTTPDERILRGPEIIERYDLIYVNKDEFIGIKDKFYVEINRMIFS